MDAKTSAAIERLKQNKDLAAQLMRSGDGKMLMELLTRSDGGAALDDAAARAAKGDTAALSQLLRGLMNDPKAAEAMRRLSDSAKR